SIAKSSSTTGRVLGFQPGIFSPMVRAADSTSRSVASVWAALAGLTSIATRAALGNSSRSSSSRFAANSVVRKPMPVRFPPGRARLATRPTLTGSSPVMKTMGIVDVAALAANVEGIPAGVITATKISRQHWQSIQLILGPAVLDRHILAHDIASLPQALAERP